MEYKVLNWDFNQDRLVYYDVMPYLREAYAKLPKRDKPVTKEQIRDFILREAQYQFWSRCQYEIIVTGWPQQKNKEKIDVFDQMKQNIDVIVSIFNSEIQ